MSNVVRTLALSVVAIEGFAATTDPEPLQPLVDLPTDIKSQPLADALTAWAQLTGYQIVVPQSKAAERIVPAIKGKMTAQESLDRLLAGTGLIFERINGRTVAIQEDFSAPLPPEPDPKGQQILASLEKIEVTGTRLPMTAEDIKANGWPLTPAPVTVFTRKKLDQLGVSQTADFLDYLSQAPFRTRESQLTAQFAQTRGLGYDNTLVLINGRRTLPSALAVQWNAFDLNNIPLSTVDRIEVLSDSGSAVYGSDAIGGVINIITRKNIQDTTLNFDYGTAAGGGGEQRAALLSGYSNETLRTSVVLEYFSRDFLHGTERERSNNQDFRHLGGPDYRFIQSNPGNVRSLTTANLPGLSSTFAAIPVGSTGIDLTPEDFVATAGHQNKQSLFKYASILPETERRGASASIELDLTSQVTAFGDALYLNKTTMYQTPPELLRGAVVPATNPFNPFGVAVAVDYLFSDIGPVRIKEHSEMWRALTGLRGTLSTWDWELSFLKSEDQSTSVRFNEVDLGRVAAALANSDPTQTINLFADSYSSGSASIASFRVDPRTGRYTSAGAYGSGVLRGPLLQLPAGPVEMVAGGEWRAEEVKYNQPNLSGAPGSVVLNGERKVSALFGEVRIPLVDTAMRVPAIDELSFTLAARQDHYSDFGNAFNPQFGLLWKPIPDVMFRASYGTSFRAPPQYDLFLPKSNISFAIPDPLRNGQPATVTIAAGGNSKLKPTDARSASAGVVLMPSTAPGLQLSASYWQIDMKRLVTIPPLFTLAASDPSSTDRVRRAERTPQDIAAGLPGALTYIDLSRINAGSLKTSGVDLAAKYFFETPIGNFEPNLAATWVNEYETVVFPGERAIERTGIANRLGTIPRWQIIGSLEWSLRGLSFSTTVRHTPHYWDTNGLDQVVDRHVEPKTLVDAQVSFDLGDLLEDGSRWTGLRATAGASNLFNQAPNFSEVQKELGYDPSQEDLRERFSYIKLSKRF